MIYLQLNPNQIKILFLKKTLLGQYDIVFYEKKYQLSFLKGGQLINPDLTASAIKEAMNLIANSKINDKDITLILPQESFEYLRTDVPNDMAPAVLSTYIKEKARAQMTADLDTSHYAHMILESEGQKKMVFYALDNDSFNKFQQPFTLLDLKVKAVIPESLAYFKLFEKTLRKEKKENIMYTNYDASSVSAYIYDSFGLLETEMWHKDLKEKDSIEEVLRAKAQELEKKGIKLNRLIISGEQSETIRQDTFTKNVGVWTNPLKRILPHFYSDYLKMFASQGNQQIPYLQFDACIGGFILSVENKDFSLLQNRLAAFSPRSYRAGGSRMSMPSFSFPWKPALFFILSFTVSLGALWGFSRMQAGGFSLDFSTVTARLAFAQPTPTPIPPTPTPEPPTPTPTPEVDRAEIRIKVLNGGGIAGKATEVKNILTDLGYEQVLTGNADNFDYKQTKILVKEKTAKYFSIVAADIKDFAKVASSSALDEEEAADVQIIIGSDWR
ncbi:MAG: LytR C-terminal domain-containing protein [Patescibacteria group bacterium]|nr:LytR C-terminal domain-containing protein [Patescibacteria group bacterium]